MTMVDETMTLPRSGVTQEQVLLYAEDFAATMASRHTLSRRTISRKATGQTKVLLADDEPSLRRLINATLAGEGYKIFQATNGEEVMTILQDEHPSLVILDLNMPGPNGLDICQRIKAAPALKDIAVVILTGNSHPAVHARCLAAGADAFLTKPFRPVDLLEALEATLGSP